MNVTSRTTFVAVALTTALLLVSQTALAQRSEPASIGIDRSLSAPAPTFSQTFETPANRDLPASGVVDVALQDDGVIRGRVLHTDGRPIDGSRVVLRKGDRIVAAVISEADGQFQVKGLSSGVYQIETPTGYGMYRFWTQDAAPPSAMTHALLVSKEPILRGQFGMFSAQEMFTLAVGAGGLAVGVIALDELDDQEEKLDRLLKENNGSAADKIPVSP